MPGNLTESIEEIGKPPAQGTAAVGSSGHYSSQRSNNTENNSQSNREKDYDRERDRGRDRDRDYRVDKEREWRDRVGGREREYRERDRERDYRQDRDRFSGKTHSTGKDFIY